MPDKNSRPSPGKPVEEFLMTPHEHRVYANKLEQLKNHPQAQRLAKLHRWLGEQIQQRLNAGTARIKERRK
jgi:hypothetical protein